MNTTTKLVTELHSYLRDRLTDIENEIHLLNQTSQDEEQTMDGLLIRNRIDELMRETERTYKLMDSLYSEIKGSEA